MTKSTAAFGRVIGTILLVGAAILLVVRFGQLDANPAPALGHYPGGGELVTDYPRYLGSKVELYARVISEDPLIVQGTYGGTELALRIVGIETRPTTGQYLHVYGVVGQDNTIRVLNAVVYPANRIWFTYTVSGLAVVWTVGRFLNRWRLNLATLAFSPRRRPRFRPGDWRLFGRWLGGE